MKHKDERMDRPLILQFAERQTTVPPIQGFYDEKTGVTLVRENGKYIPLINSSSSHIQTMTKTEVRSESEDTDPSPNPDSSEPEAHPEMMTKTFVQRESDD